MLIPVLNERPSVFTVSELNAQIKALLETALPFVWVRGEISNFRVPASGHYYFTLKDEASQVRAVFFRPQHRSLRFVPESGLQVLCQARLGVYEPRGEYQLIVEVMEPQGLGALQLAFEQLKKRLEAEGLFEGSRKLPLPACPRNIGVVTSPTGAAIQDILKVLQRSPYPLCITLIPTKVQGSEACFEIAQAVETANRLQESFQWDLLIVGRGGGSLEDLWPFNEESVARAIAASRIPILSAVGHEIDLTIADLVADHRAPTPTAAAEWIVHQLVGLQRSFEGYKERMLRGVVQKLGTCSHTLQLWERRLTDPRKRLADDRLFVDDRTERLILALQRYLERLRMTHTHLDEKLEFVQPLKKVHQCRILLAQRCKELLLHQQKLLDHHRLELQKAASKLEGLSPLGVLARGYAIAYTLPEKRVVSRAGTVQPGQEILVRLAEGHLECTVQKTVK